MSKKSRLRWPIDRQHGKRAETLIQSQPQLFYHIHWSLPRWLNWKKSLLVTCNVLRLFVNTLTFDNKYSLLRRDNSWQTIQILLSEKQKTFSQFLMHFSHLHQILNIIKEIWPSSLLYFRNYEPRRTWLDKCLKSPLWGKSSKGNVVNGPQHWFNLNASIFSIFRDHCENNYVGKSHP